MTSYRRTGRFGGDFHKRRSGILISGRRYQFVEIRTYPYRLRISFQRCHRRLVHRAVER